MDFLDYFFSMLVVLLLLFVAIFYVSVEVQLYMESHTSTYVARDKGDDK